MVNKLSSSEFVDRGDEPESRGIQSVEISARFLEALCRVSRAIPLGQLSDMVEIAPSKAHRYMASLVRAGLARQEENGRYDLGPLALKLGLAAIGRSDIVEAAGRVTDQLAQVIGLSVHLTVWSDWGPVVIRLRQGRSPVISTVRLGSVLPLARSATGMIYLAFMDTVITQPVLEREFSAAAFPLDRSSVSDRIKEARANGFASVDGLLVPGLVAISAPILNFQNDLACAVTATGTDPTISDPTEPFIGHLRNACDTLSKEFGGTFLRQ